MPHGGEGGVLGNLNDIADCFSISVSLRLWLPRVDITDQGKQPPSNEGNSQEQGTHN